MLIRRVPQPKTLNPKPFSPKQRLPSWRSRSKTEGLKTLGPKEVNLFMYGRALYPLLGSPVAIL